jgi:polysaccharide biosynthesis protein PslH
VTAMRILWLKTELLHPVDKGGRIRTHAMLRELKRRHHVTYLTLDDGGAAADAVARADEYCHALERIPFRAAPKFSAGFYADLLRNLASPLPWFVARYRSAAMRRAIAEQVRTGGYDAVVCDFLVPAVNLPRRLPCATVLFQHNVEAAIWKRHAEVERNPLKRAYLRLQWRRAVRYEGAACRRFDHVVAVSPDDREAMRRDYGVQAVTDVPTGVDTDFFRPSGTVAADPHALVFTGSMDWMPNVDAIRHFAQSILPRIRAAVPDVTLTVVGRDPHPDVRALAEADPSITVTGRVDDVRPYMERAALYVVPLRVGGGTRLKIPEAMGMEMPIVSTTVGAEGLPLRDGEHVVLADDPERFADAVVALLRDPPRARRMGAAAAALVREHFGWAAATAPFDDALHAAVRAHAASAETGATAARLSARPLAP